jgi:DNA helicase-2/ATP-dependent DNA helicase PcrA
MAIHEQERMQEEQRVTMVVGKIRNHIEDLETEVLAQKENVTNMRKEFWSDVTVNTANWEELLETKAAIFQESMVIADQERKFSHASEELARLKRLVNSPYFGRVDFREDDSVQTQKIYIGISSFRDQESDEFLIYDWRAPISSLFYDHMPGPADYEAPGGKIQGIMEGKRQYVIRGGKLLYLFDTGMMIGDEILQQVLGKTADTQMSNIVATIQKEQNAIIRNDRKRVVIVQGVAGSGKTSVALQRIAYLMYKHRHSLSPDHMLLFSPNPLFKHYVSNVLPELGETSVQQTTLSEYLEFRLGKEFSFEHPFNQLEYILNENQSPDYPIRLESIRFKASMECYQLILNYAKVLEKHGMIFKHIPFRGEVLISAERITEQFYSYDSSIPLNNRLQLVQEWLLKELDSLEEQEREKEWVEEEMELLDQEEYRKAYKKTASKKRFSWNDYQTEEDFLRAMVVRKYFKPIKKRIKAFKFVNLLALYRQLFANQELLKQASDDLCLPDRMEEICDFSMRTISRENLYFEDTFPLLLLKELVEGFHTFNSVRYVVVDEAQDYSPFQFQLLRRVFPRAQWTFLGDLHQAVWAHPSCMARELLMELEQNDPNVEVYRLTKSYRSTKEIVEFTRGIMEAGDLILPFERHGDSPRLIHAENIEEMQEKMVQNINELINRGYKTVAILCKTEAESKEVFAALRGRIDGLQLISKEIHSYKEGTLVIPVYLAKGVEFDAVLVHNASKDQYCREVERNLFYTACTRAMHDLSIYYTGELTPFVDQSREYTYVSL